MFVSYSVIELCLPPHLLTESFNVLSLTDREGGFPIFLFWGAAIPSGSTHLDWLASFFFFLTNIKIKTIAVLK